MPKGRRYGVTKLRSNFSSNSNGDEPLKLTFVTQVLKEAHAAWLDESDVDEQRSALLKYCLSLLKMS